MYEINLRGVAAASAAPMSSALRVAMSAVSTAHPTVATHDAIPATKRRAAAATVASVNRSTI